MGVSGRAFQHRHSDLDRSCVNVCGDSALLHTTAYIPLLHTTAAYHCCIPTTAAYHCCSQRLQCRTAASAVEVQGSVYVLGGYNPKDFPADNNRLDLVERYDVHTDSWEQVFSFAMYCYVVSSLILLYVLTAANSFISMECVIPLSRLCELLSVIRNDQCLEPARKPRVQGPALLSFLGYLLYASDLVEHGLS